ncbi:MAG TPA: hypothetical protein DCK93_11490 [Blastocatellia bacterium]|nr:hypothetical protein [Blastocatellia bacterium]
MFESGQEVAVEEMIRYLKALVILQAAMMERVEGGPKPEVLLHRAGLGIQEISDVLDRSYAAVAQTLSRERRAKRHAGPRHKLLPEASDES